MQYKKMIDEYLDQTHGDIEKATETIVRVEYDEKKAVYQERNAYIANLQAQVKAVAASPMPVNTPLVINQAIPGDMTKSTPVTVLK